MATVPPHEPRIALVVVDKLIEAHGYACHWCLKRYSTMVMVEERTPWLSNNVPGRMAILCYTCKNLLERKLNTPISHLEFYLNTWDNSRSRLDAVKAQASKNPRGNGLFAPPINKNHVFTFEEIIGKEE